MSFAFSGELIILCPFYCASCSFSSNVLTCLVLNEGFVFSSSGSGVIPLRCADSCKTCSQNNISLCTSCFKKRSLQSDGSCASCSDKKCLECSSSIDSCTSCTQGFALSSALACVACSENCITCTVAGAGGCDTCIDDFVTQNNLCSQCPAGCSVCDTSQPLTCLKCSKGKFMATDGTCNQCSLNCKKCTSTAVCVEGFDGFQVEGGVCVEPLGPPCTKSLGGVCTKCAASYTLVSGACVANVSSCTAANPCYYCPLTYYLSAGLCSSCPASTTCLSCNPTNTTNCLHCAKGYYLDQSYTCQACPSGCKICKSATYCQQPTGGYYLEYLFGLPTGNFLACSSLCANCYSDTNQCTSCPTGYTLISSKCQSNTYVTIKMVINPIGSWPTWGNYTLTYKRTFFGLRFYMFWQGFLGIFSFRSKPHRMRLHSCGFGSVIV